jgi:oligopeptide/dipeptide ABC transporter ATP-binding protein
MCPIRGDLELNPMIDITHPVTVEPQPILEVRHLEKTFVLGKSVIRQIMGLKPDYLRAVHNVNLHVFPGECLGLVGESGCGKTTLGRCILRLYEPDAGQVLYEGQDFLQMKGQDAIKMRRKMQVVFQDPSSSLNPRMSIGHVLGEVSLVHNICTPKEVPDRVAYLLNMVGMGSDLADRFPHELSGGQRQRIGLARALAVEPSFIVADEPVSALDVSIQAQVVNLLVELQDRLHLTMMFITHDLRLVHYVSHRVAVMYLGSIVELANSKTLFTNPMHPYTTALLAAAPKVDPRQRSKGSAIQGEPPSPINIGKCCPFKPRCNLAIDRCGQEEPQLEEKEPGHFVSCFVR